MNNQSQKKSHAELPGLTREQREYDNFLEWLTSSGETSDRAARSTGSTQFDYPSDEALRRCSAIPLLSQEINPAPIVTGTIAHDSWAYGAAPALRDITLGHVRRVNLRAGRTNLEIVAERRENHWEFIARAYQGGKVVHDSVLKIGRRKYIARSGGFFQWSSGSVPRFIELLSLKKTLTFEELAW